MKFKLSESSSAGIGFGLTSGVITTLGAIVGIFASSQSRAALFAAIVTVSVADAFSDALGEHISEESRYSSNDINVKSITLSTFFTKLIVGLSFLIPFLLFDLTTAVLVSILYGSILISLLSFGIAKKSGKKSKNVILEHLFVGLLVVVITFSLGSLIEKAFERISI